jgi:Phosphopantetheine attachment site
LATRRARIAAACCGSSRQVAIFSFSASRNQPPCANEFFNVVANVLGVDEDAVRRNPNMWNESGADSLDVVELIMELGEEFD